MARLLSPVDTRRRTGEGWGWHNVEIDFGIIFHSVRHWSGVVVAHMDSIFLWFCQSGARVGLEGRGGGWWPLGCGTTPDLVSLPSPVGVSEYSGDNQCRLGHDSHGTGGPTTRALVCRTEIKQPLCSLGAAPP